MIFVDGVPVDSVPAVNRGLAYGDGVFRTFAMRGGRPENWRLQYDKLIHDCQALGIDSPAAGDLEQDLERIAAVEPDCAAKIIVTRGASARGYAPSVMALPNRVVISGPLPTYPEEFQRVGVRVRCCALRLARQPALAGLKHLNRLENVLARAEWQDPAIAEGLLLDTEGAVIGGTMSNLFVMERDTLATPDLGLSGVAGVTRQRVMEACTRLGIACRVERISLDRLRTADGAFLVNSLIGLWPVRTLDDTRYGDNHLMPALREALAATTREDT